MVLVTAKKGANEFEVIHEHCIRLEVSTRTDSASC